MESEGNTARAARGGLPPALEGTDLSWLGVRHAGKVRDSYVRGATRVLVATDRLSAFDRSVTSVPLKGQVLTQLAQFWFEQVGGTVPHHVIAVPDPCVVVAREVSIVPVEVVVRGFLAGSGWRDYSAGRAISGVRLPSGLREFDQLPHPIITPSTKEALGRHDVPISEQEVVARGIVGGDVWEEIRSYALSLFALGSRQLAGRGLIFVDTKYEFGLLDGRVVLADEIHTLDSSRFWIAESYERRRAEGEAPEMLDKEPIRRWLMERGFSGEGPVPPITDEQRSGLMEHYVRSYSLITGLEFRGSTEEPQERIERNLRRYFS